MKTTWRLILFLMALSLAPIQSAETNIAVVNIEQKVRDIDLKLLLGQYENIQKQILDLQLQEAMLAAGSDDLTDEERKKQSMRIHKINDALASLRFQVMTQMRQLAEEGAKHGN